MISINVFRPLMNLPRNQSSDQLKSCKWLTDDLLFMIPVSAKEGIGGPSSLRSTSPSYSPCVPRPLWVSSPDVETDRPLCFVYYYLRCKRYFNFL